METMNLTCSCKIWTTQLVVSRRQVVAHIMYQIKIMVNILYYLLIVLSFTCSASLLKFQITTILPGESPLTYAHKVKELVKLAYPSFPDATRLSIAKDYFVRGSIHRYAIGIKNNCNGFPRIV